MKLIFDNNDDLICFGMQKIKSSLEKKGIFYVEEYNKSENYDKISDGIIVKKLNNKSVGKEYPDQSFELKRFGGIIYIKGGDSRGIMYGCLEWAEMIDRGVDLSDGKIIFQKPALCIRGIKFNLPFVPYGNGDPFKLNEETCMNIEFWHSYIDMLAVNRYNCLSLWSEHPFHLMVVSPKYRNANPYSDIQIDRNIQFFKELIQYAWKHGIDIYLFTWNIRIPIEVVKGLGLPESLGVYEGKFVESISMQEQPLNTYRRISPLIKDYFKEMILQLLLTYPQLKGLGVSASEWMDGNGIDREEWIVDTYVSAIKESGRKIPFIHRTNMQNAGNEIKSLVQDLFDKEDFYISWKYSNAHCYSHPKPQFEKLWHAWDGIELENTQVLYTVRNDDFFTLRWGDPEYIKEYVKGMIKPYVKGFYWGADGYVWANDFQHFDCGHKTWSYDYERHELEFQLWGRISYNPDLENDIWMHILKTKYGEQFASDFNVGLVNASKIIPAVNRQFWLDYDTQWYPEGCMSKSGFKTILDFMNGIPMPGIKTMGIKQYIEMELSGKLEQVGLEYEENPIDILNILRKSSKETKEAAERLDRTLGDFKAGHLQCTLLDLYAWAEMGSYYECKISAALELNRYVLSRDLCFKAKAVKQLEKAVAHWNNLGYYWSLHNKSYMMGRVNKIFGYPFYLEDVKRDVRLAEDFDGLCDSISVSESVQ